MPEKTEQALLPDELRPAVWRDARLSALCDSVAKIRHDLRNILSPALLAAERLHRNSDPAVQQAANTLIPAMHRAVELVSRIADYAQEGPPVIIPSLVALHHLIGEAADSLSANSVTIVNLVPTGLTFQLDRIQLCRVLVNLFRNATEAGATQISVSLEEANGIALVIADNGPGLPPEAIANPFHPFTAAGPERAGLGLAIARELIRAHGGDLTLRQTDRQGTAFAILLPPETPAKQ
jgi:signal transduction histidine kinase